MTIDIITLHPELLESPFSHSIIQRGRNAGLLNINVISLRPFGLGKHKQVDDYQYGGGAGMVMMCEPLDKCITELKSQKSYDEVIYLTPDGETFNQNRANRLSVKQNLLLICGHYKGIDQRIRELHVTSEISIGDFVLSGGELGAAIIVDAIGRLIPGVLSDETSALTDSFQDDLLAPPVFTRPVEFKGLKVPQVLLSGNDAKIQEWRHEQALERTARLRPDLYQHWKAN
ncbi:MAG: tRNA (guanosine(37)-N1)-methyltransferase TrmD [Saprospiraceae bacterium]